jgi:t-SNARE complex subunit (syntaxin)
VNYVHKGEKNLIKAKENMKKARKKKCIILIIAIVILLIVLVPILIRFV